MASCADATALQNATTAAIASPISSPAPAASAAGANTTNTPAPTIADKPTTTASPVPSRRASPDSVNGPSSRRVGHRAGALWATAAGDRLYVQCARHSASPLTSSVVGLEPVATRGGA